MIDNILNNQERFEATQEYQWYWINNRPELHTKDANIKGAKLSVLLSKTTHIETFEEDGVTIHKREYVPESGKYKKTVYVKFIDEKHVEVMKYIDSSKSAWEKLLGNKVDDTEVKEHSYWAKSAEDMQNKVPDYSGDWKMDVDVVLTQYYVLEDTTPEDFLNSETKAEFAFELEDDGTVKLTNNSIIGGKPYNESDSTYYKFYYRIEPLVPDSKVVSGEVDIYPSVMADFLNKPSVKMTNDPRKNADINCDNFENCLIKMMMIYKVPGTQRLQADTTFMIKKMEWENIDLYGEIALDPEVMFNSYPTV